MRRLALLAALLLALPLAACLGPVPDPEAPPTEEPPREEPPDEPPAEPRRVALLEMTVATGPDTTLTIGEVLGSPTGRLVSPFRVDAERQVVVANLSPDTTQLVWLHQESADPVLVADATRAIAEAAGGDPDQPAILEFELHEGRFEITVVQPNSCASFVNNRGETTNGTGPFRVPPLGPADWVVFDLTGEHEACATARVGFRALGHWPVEPVDAAAREE